MSTAWHGVLLEAFRLLPNQRTARALVRHAHQQSHASRAAVERLRASKRYRTRARAAGPARPVPPFVLNNLRMPEPPWSHLNLYCDPARPRPGPESPGALEEAVRSALASGKDATAKAVGGGWGFSNVAFTTGQLTQLSGLDRVFAVDDTVNANGKKLLQFEAGATIGQLNLNMPAGYGLINQPGCEWLTFAGVASAGGHGSSLKWGALADAIRSMRLLTVDGNRQPRWLQIEPRDGITDPRRFREKNRDVTLIQDDDTFHACIVSMGCMGIIYSMIIELRPVKTITETRALMPWSDAKLTFEKLVEENSDPDSDLHSFVYWLNPYPTLAGHQHVVVGTYYERGDPKEGDRPEVMKSTGGSMAVENVVVTLVNWLPELAPWLIDGALLEATDAGVVMDPPDALNFGAPNHLDVLATAAGVPIEETLSTADRLSRLLQGRPDKLTSTFGLRFVPRARGLLSPQRARDTCMIEVPCLAKTDGIDDTLHACWEDLVAHGARPHWGQRNSLDAAGLRRAYGDAAVGKFRGVRRDLDPTRFFDNAFTRQVGL